MKSNEKTAYLPQQVSEYLAVLGNKAWMIGLVTVALTLAAIIFIAFMPDQYRATTTILVDPQQIPERYVATTVSSDPGERLNTISQQMLSSSRLGQIIDELNLYADMKSRPREDVIESMRRHITLQVKQGSSQGLSAFTVSYECGSAAQAADVPNKLADKFIAWNVKSRNQVAEGTTLFMSRELEEAKKDLEAQEKKLAEFKMQHIGEMPEQQQANQQAIASLTAQQQGITDRLNQLDRDKQLLSQLPEPLPQTPTQMTERQRLEQEQRQLNSQITDLKKKYTDSHPDVVAVESRLRQVQTQIKALPPDSLAAGNGSDSAVRLNVIEKEQQQLKHKNEEIQAKIAAYQAKVDSGPLQDQRLSELTRDYEISKEQYRSLLEKKNSAAIAGDLEKQQQGERFTILDRARAPERPFKPNRLNLMMVSLVGSLLFAGALVIAQDTLSGAIKAERELKSLLPGSVKFLGSVPRIDVKEDRQRRLWLRTVAVSISLLGCVAVAIILWKVHPIL